MTTALSIQSLHPVGAVAAAADHTISNKGLLPYEPSGPTNRQQPRKSRCIGTPVSAFADRLVVYGAEAFFSGA